MDGENTETGKKDKTLAFNLPHSQCEEGYEHLGSTILPAGTVVDYAGEFLQAESCGPLPEVFRKIKHDGETYWVLERAYFRTFDDNGAHTGMVDYLVQLP